ncbi:hypothetical protein NOV72_02145 [Caballeronia novacaledonica]|uniref:Uncharacterized protein n=1 Tax=Caballeronia novacaledonica TaxID=1544861 RepID=A0A2U3I495_9BURK|nr:hypothetical protein [Caballeronia novacaledonica]SPB14914.1 hypothetical protein NOV72_02145 [Caballeronia novacaledonica]
MSDALAGALCVLAALSAGSSMRSGAVRSRALAAAGAVVVVAACASGGAAALAPMAAALLLATVAGLAGYRLDRNAPGASTQALLATIAFVAWMLPDLNGAYAVLAGGGIAALGKLLCARGSRENMTLPPLHLVCAGACAALAYVFGAQPDVLAVVSVVAMIALIGAHLSLAMGGVAGAPTANVLSSVAACGLAVAAAIGGRHGALVVAALAIAIGCARSAAPVGVVREAP